MATGYFAQVVDGVVMGVRRVSAERIAEYPELYPGNWVEILDMSQYPAPGWTWDTQAGLQAPQTSEVTPE